jgi:hypothetical protein
MKPINFDEVVLEPMSPGAKVAQDLASLVNIMGSTEREQFVLALLREHRTLQQQVFEVFLQFALGLALDVRGHDARNEWAHERAQEIIDKLCAEKGIDPRFGLTGPFI